MDDATGDFQEAVAADQLRAVRAAITDYHLALDRREHGDAAAGRAIDAIEQALGLSWEQGKALDTARTSGGATAERAGTPEPRSAGEAVQDGGTPMHNTTIDLDAEHQRIAQADGRFATVQARATRAGVTLHVLGGEGDRAAYLVSHGCWSREFSDLAAVETWLDRMEGAPCRR